MIPLVPLLVDTAVAYENPETVNFVHEWGVVVFQENSILLCGGPWPAPEYPDDVCAEAPIVWFHGEPFSGTFCVQLPEGEAITFVYPEPSSLKEDRVEWGFSAGIPYSCEETLPVNERDIYHGPFSWAIDSWRAVPSLELLFHVGNVRENFVYYECTVNRNFTDNFFSWGNSGNPVFIEGAVVEALYCAPQGVFPLQVQPGEFVPVDPPMGGELSGDLACETLCEWAGSTLKTSEIQALWETWEPELTAEDSRWILFPIPPEYHNEISMIYLDTSHSSMVEYNRLFLGAVELSPE